MFIILNLLLTSLMTWFTLNVYSSIPSTGFVSILIFAAWNVLFWLISFFYNKKAFYKTPKILALITFYFKELIIASIRVAYEIVSLKNRMQPAVIAFPLEAKTDFEITLLANFITLTPGTLSIDVSNDKKTLFIHEVYLKAGDKQNKIDQIKRGFEKKILNITRYPRR